MFEKKRQKVRDYYLETVRWSVTGFLLGAFSIVANFLWVTQFLFVALGVILILIGVLMAVCAVFAHIASSALEKVKSEETTEKKVTILGVSSCTKVGASSEIYALLLRTNEGTFVLLPVHSLTKKDVKEVSEYLTKKKWTIEVYVGSKVAEKIKNYPI